jgi:2-oxoglutarate dehydrogenase E2 component (dihydrolipoamide succinyltransferase)
VSLKQPLHWLKEVGDKIEADEAVLEIAADKVDSEGAQ